MKKRKSFWQIIKEAYRESKRIAEKIADKIIK